MINLRVLVPEATQNYIQNPQFRYATTGWFTVGSTLTRSLDFARFGIASGKVVTNGAALGEGAYYRVSNLSGISDVITVSVYLRGNVGDEKVRLRLQDDPTGFEWTTTVLELRTDRWIRAEITGRCTGGNDIRLKVETADTVARAYTFYVDGAQMERKAYSTSYCDGDQPGCRWNVSAGSSVSSRTADTREGGRWIPLAGPCRPNNDIYVTVLGGFGDPPVQNNIQPWASAPGSFYQNQKILDRVVTLNFTVKNEKMHASKLSELSMRKIHELRQQLVDLFKTDKTLNDEAFWFEYSETNSDKALYIRMRYEAGLDGSWDVRNGWFNTFAVRLIAVDPLWYEDTYEVKQLSTKDYLSSATALDLWGRLNGQWQPIRNAAGVGVSANGVWAIKMAPDGSIYFCGQFTNPNNRIMKWDGSTLTVLGNNGANGNVYDLDVAADGTVYAVGDFTAIGGVAANRVAKYNPVTDTWSAMGTGLAGGGAIGYAVCVAPNGQIYVGGDFTTAGGVSCLYVARWDGFQWRTVGATSGVNTIVYTIINAGNGKTLYMGGIFVTSNGGSVTYNYVAQIDTTSNLLSQMGNGIDNGVGGLVRTLVVGRDGVVYAGGQFPVSNNTIMRWSGGALWSVPGTGLINPGVSVPGLVYKLALGTKGEIYAAGDFTLAGTRNVVAFAKYYGDTWLPVEVNLLGQTVSNKSGRSILQHTNGDLYLGLLSSAPFQYQYPKINTVTNPGTTAVFPVIYASGQGTLKYISNIKTGQEIFFDLTIFSGEEVFIDFSTGTIRSTTRGNLLYTLMPGSEIRSVYLLPGENQFSVLMDNDVTPTMQIGFQLQDWSADAVVDAEALE